MEALIVLTSYFALLSPLTPLNLMFALFTVAYITLRLNGKYKYIVLTNMFSLSLICIFSSVVFSVVAAGILTILYVILKYRIDGDDIDVEDFSARVLTYVTVSFMLLDKIDNINDFIGELSLWSLTDIHYYTHVTFYMVSALYLISYDVLKNVLKPGERDPVFLVLVFTTTVAGVLLLSCMAYIHGDHIVVSKTLDLSRYLLPVSSMLLLLYHRLRVRSKTF